jgi:signal transduction histidine kinase
MPPGTPETDSSSAAAGPRHAASSERQQTDESLRAEREAADLALERDQTDIDETADAVVSRARTRADAVLAAARARSDRRLSTHVVSRSSSETVDGERAREDDVVRAERADADEVVVQERADHASALSSEREETDTDLSNERARSDHALQTRDEFMGIVSHELRNMLNAMMGSAELIASGVGRENHVDHVRMNAQRIQRSAVRMERLIGDLVDLASIEAGRLAVTLEAGDPTLVAMEAVEIFQAQASARGVSLTTEMALPPSVVMLDPARILQVLTNLLSNAMKFTPAQGRVAIRLSRVGDIVRFAVSDTGAGVPTDQLEAVFERFVQLTKNDRRGVGLGLYISRAIVEGHGGRMWAENAAGGGSTFSFTLPAL